MQIAKIFMNGRSQAVRLPAEYRFDTNEVFIHKDPITGDVILSTHKAWTSWDEFLARRDLSAIPEEFMNEREQESAQIRDLFSE